MSVRLQINRVIYFYPTTMLLHHAEFRQTRDQKIAPAINGRPLLLFTFTSWRDALTERVYNKIG